MPTIINLDEIESLTLKQETALDYARNGLSFFLTGSAGTGKSFLLTRIISELAGNSRRKMNIALTATTGIAAVAINGQTLHKWSGIRLGNGTPCQLVDGIKKNAKAVNNWRNVKILIVDEISMLHPTLLEKLDTVAKLMRNSDKPFGGIQVIFVGDFYQLPPVEKNMQPDMPQYCFETPAWKSIIGNNFVELDTVFRQKDRKWICILEKVRRGIVDDEVREALLGRVGVKLDLSNGILPTRLRPTNAQAERINSAELNKLATQPKTFIAKWTVPQMPSWLEQQVKQNMLDSVRVPENQTLKVGAQVILKMNYDVKRGLANGSRGIVVEMSTNKDKVDVVKVLFINGVQEVITPYDFEWEYENNRIVYKQIPLMLGWALTIHKSQGMTLDAVEANLNDAFLPEQIYVSLSRSVSLERLSLVGIDPEQITANPKVVEFYKDYGDPYFELKFDNIPETVKRKTLPDAEPNHAKRVKETETVEERSWPSQFYLKLEKGEMKVHGPFETKEQLVESKEYGVDIFCRFEPLEKV